MLRLLGNHQRINDRSAERFHFFSLKHLSVGLRKNRILSRPKKGVFYTAAIPRHTRFTTEERRHNSARREGVFRQSKTRSRRPRRCGKSRRLRHENA